MRSSEHRRRGRIIVSLAIVSTVFAGCGSDDDASSEETALATQFIDAAHAAGIAERMTVDQAAALYGTDASNVCDAFDGDLSTSAKNVLFGNLGQRRRKTITDEAVTHSRLVIQTYCPDHLDRLRQRRERPRSLRKDTLMSTEETTTESGTSGGIKAIAMVAWPALAMLMVASVGSIAQLSDSASFGLGAVTVYLLPALLFLLPVGLVSAELATSNRGGIFVWVKDAFGDRTGFQATWFVFMNSVTLYPSLLSFGAAALATAFGRADLATNGAYMGTVVLVVFWLATWIVSRGMKSSTGISNIGLSLGTITPALFLIFFMFAWLIDGKTSQVHYDGLSSLAPPVDGLSSIALVVGTFVAFAGLEVNAVHIAHLKGPPKNYLKSVMLAALTVFVMYLLGSIAISVAVPDKTLELTSGASQAFTVYADGFGIPGLSNVLSGLLVLGALAASIAWIAGPSRSMWLVGKAGYLPRGLQKTNKNDVQMPLLLLQGAVVTVLSFVFVVAPNTSEAFAMLQDVSISLYMLMYVCMFAAAIKLRRSQPDRERPIKIRFLPVIACVGILSAVSAIILGLTPPAGYSSLSPATYGAIIAAGVIVLAIPPQFIHHFRKPSWSTEIRARSHRGTRRRRLKSGVWGRHNDGGIVKVTATNRGSEVCGRHNDGGRQSVCHKPAVWGREDRGRGAAGGRTVRGPGGRRGCSTWPAATPLRRRR